MAQVLYTGQGEFKGARMDFDPASFMKEAATASVKMYEYKQKEMQRRLEEFKELTDVKMDNLLLDKVQKEGSKKIEEYYDYATEVYDKGKGILSPEDTLDLFSKKKELEQWSEVQSNKAKAYLQQRDALLQDGGAKFDFNDSVASQKKYADDPINAEAPTLVPRYKTIDEIIDSELSKRGHDWMPSDEEELVKEGDRWVTKKVRNRYGLQTEEQRQNFINDLLANSNDFKRTITREFKTLLDANNDGEVSEEEAKALATGDMLNKIYAMTKDNIEPYRYNDLAKPSSSSNFFFGGGILSAGGYKASIVPRNNTNYVYFSGTKFPAVSIGEGNNSRKVKVSAIGRGKLYSSIEVPTNVPNTSSEGKQDELTARAFYGSSVIKATDGLWYPAKKETKETEIPITPEEEASVVTQINAAMDGAFTVMWDKTAPKPSKKKKEESNKAGNIFDTLK